MQPKLTVSGYRGIWGETLTEAIARDYVRAFARCIKSHGGTRVLIGRDGRASGPELLNIISDELAIQGLDVIDLGLMPTPSVLFLVRDQKSSGAVIATASHNPIEYNGLKFVTKRAEFTTESEVAEIETLRMTQDTEIVSRGTRTDGGGLFSRHLNTLLSHINAENIKEKKFKIALDPINSVGCETAPELLRALDAETFVINGEPNGIFAHEPEPLPKNLGGLKQAVREHGCNIGFAQDPDGDRLVLCDETGTLLSEEMTIALCFDAILEKTPGNIVINLSTSNISEDAAIKHGAEAIRSKVGEANVVSKMREMNAVAAGEGGGGIIWPTVNATRDSYVGMALILELMATTGKKLSELVATFPKYAMRKEKIAFSGNMNGAYEKLATLFPEARINRDDGIRFDFPNRSWIHVRPSNTEPVVRIIGESLSESDLSLLIKKAMTGFI